MGNGQSHPFSPGKGQVKFLIVAVDYFTKWIEAKPLTTITAQQVQQFGWKDIICRYGVPHTIMTENGRQFIDKELVKFYTGLGIKHITSSVEHPQTNGQAEAANKVILVELRKRLDTAKRRWPEELVEVLWAYRCTPQSSTNESPFSLVYGTDAENCTTQPTTTKTWPLISTSYPNSEKKPRYAT